MPGKQPIRTRLADVASSPTPSSSTFASATLGTALAVVTVWIIEAATGVQVPGEVGAALGTIGGALVGYFFPGGTRADTQ